MKIVFTCFLIGISMSLRAQNKTFGIGTAVLNPNAALQVHSPGGNQGILLPRLTTVQRTAMTLTTNDKGLVVFDTDFNSTHTWDGTAWKNNNISASASKLVFPYKDSLVLTAPTNTRLFTIKYNGTSDVGVTQFQNLYAGNQRPVVSVLQKGTGYGGSFVNDNPNSSTGVLFASTNTNVVTPANSLAPVAIYGLSEGTGALAGVFRIRNVGNPYPSLYAETNSDVDFAPAFMTRSIGSTNSAGAFYITNANNSFSALYSETAGMGNAGSFFITNANNTFTALYSETAGMGNAGIFKNTNAGNTSSTLHSETAGMGKAGIFKNTNADNTSSILFVESNGKGPAFNSNNHSAYLYSGAGNFSNTNPANDGYTVGLSHYGTGVLLGGTHYGNSGNFMDFKTSNGSISDTKIRFDLDGKGYFDGGTQTGGADVAELFDVEGERSEYEPGDVLVISESTDRTIEKSSYPNSAKVAGVYATKPGLTLTEKDLDESTDDLVPMGVLGVIPTKVCSENGAIKRGDLLVTSSRRGYAMKAIPANVNGFLVYPTGAVLGKALENLEGKDSGLIHVLVNVK